MTLCLDALKPEFYNHIIIKTGMIHKKKPQYNTYQGFC